jgi:hypothetical protein
MCTLLAVALYVQVEIIMQYSIMGKMRLSFIDSELISTTLIIHIWTLRHSQNSNVLSEWVSELLMFNANSAVFQHGFSIKHPTLKEGVNTGCLGIRIMFPSGATCLSADCCFSEVAIYVGCLIENQQIIIWHFWPDRDSNSRSTAPTTTDTLQYIIFKMTRTVYVGQSYSLFFF